MKNNGTESNLEHPYLSVIIPAYNESKRIPATIDTILRYLEPREYRWELIIVDDGSTDNMVAVVKDIIEFDSKSQFDVSIAMGLFDYTKDPLPILTKMQELTTGKMILSFPRLYTWRAPIRRIRLRLKKLDVFFYSKKRLKSIFESTGFKKYEIVKIGKLHCVVILLE